MVSPRSSPREGRAPGDRHECGERDHPPASDGRGGERGWPGHRRHGKSRSRSPRRSRSRSRSRSRDRKKHHDKHKHHRHKSSSHKDGHHKKKKERSRSRSRSGSPRRRDSRDRDVRSSPRRKGSRSRSRSRGRDGRKDRRGSRDGYASPRPSPRAPGEGKKEEDGGEAPPAGHEAAAAEDGASGAPEPSRGRRKLGKRKKKTLPGAAAGGGPLSFQDDVEAAGDGPGRGLGDATANRFKHERKSPPGWAPSARPPGLEPWGGEGDEGPVKHMDPSDVPLRIGVSQACGMRSYMEDCHAVVASYQPANGYGVPIDDGVLRTFCGVYDGHNGAKAAQHAAQRLHIILGGMPAMRNWSGSRAGAEEEEAAIGAAFHKTFHDLDDEILKSTFDEGTRDGSTVCVAVRIGGMLYTAHAGDSRAVMCRRGGVAKRLTEDHKPDLEVERARVESVGGRVEFAGCWRVICEPSEDRPGAGLAVARSLGDYDFKHPIPLVGVDPDVLRVELVEGDSFVILASDGVWDVIDDQGAVDVVSEALARHGGSRDGGVFRRGGVKTAEDAAKAAAEALVEASLVRGTGDNLTAIVMLLQWA